MKVKVCIVLLLTCVFFLCLVGCKPEGPIGVPVPDQIKDLQVVTTEPEETEKKHIEANLYFDNTQSMYGFVANGLKSNFVVTNKALYDIMVNYSGASFNVLSPDSSNKLNWSELPDKDVFNSDYKKKDFYTYKGFLNKSGEGPLKLLMKQGTVNYDELNIFITDLAEQDLECKKLAQDLSDEAQKREDCSVALFCIESYFKGVAKVPLPGVVSPENDTIEMAEQEFDGVRPFYIVIIGPTKELQNLVNELTSILKSSGNSDQKFYSSVFYAHNGLQSVDFSSLQPIPLYDERNFKGYTAAVSNECFNFESVDTEDVFSDVTCTLPCFNFKYNTDNTPKEGNAQNEGCVNIVVPCSNLFGGDIADSTTYKIDKENISVQYYMELADDTTTGDEAEDDDTTKEKKYAWTGIEAFYYKDMLSFEDKYMNKGDKLKRYNDSISEKSKRSLEKSDEEPVYTVESPSGALQIKLTVNDIQAMKEKYGNYISVIIPVLADRAMDKPIPDWINTYNLQDAPSFDRSKPQNNLLYFTKTDGLIGFFKVLIGKTSSAEEQDVFMRNMQKTITKVAINLYLGKMED